MAMQQHHQRPDHSSRRAPETSGFQRQVARALSSAGNGPTNASGREALQSASALESHVHPGKPESRRLVPSYPGAIERRQIRTRAILELEAALRRVTFTDVFVDKLHVLLVRRPSRDQRKALHRLAGKHVMIRDTHPVVVKHGWPYWISVEQPSEALLQVINLLNAHAVNYLELSRDAMALHQKDLRQLKAAWRRLVMIRRPHEVHRLFRFWQTIYWTRRGAARGFVMYDDRPSKLTGRHCLHVDLRLRGKGTIEALGVGTVDKLTPANRARVFGECVKLVDVLNRDEVQREIDAWIDKLVAGYMRRKKCREGAAFDGANSCENADSARQNWRVVVSGLLFNNVSPDFASLAEWGQAPVTNLVCHFPNLVRHRLMYVDRVIG